MDDVTALEDAPGGKKGHFIIHFGPMHMHLKSDDVAVKNKWFSIIGKLWKHYKAIAEARDQDKKERVSSMQSSPSHYKSEKINPKYLLEISATHNEAKPSPSSAAQVTTKLKEVLIQPSLDLLDAKVTQNHMFLCKLKLAKGTCL